MWRCGVKKKPTHRWGGLITISYTANFTKQMFCALLMWAPWKQEHRENRSSDHDHAVNKATPTLRLFVFSLAFSILKPKQHISLHAHLMYKLFSSQHFRICSGPCDVSDFDVIVSVNFPRMQFHWCSDKMNNESITFLNTYSVSPKSFSYIMVYHIIFTVTRTG